MDARIATVRGFCAAWSGATAPHLAGWFTEDGVYHNIPLTPVVGRPAIEKALAGFLAIMSIDIHVLHIAACDAVVMTERIEEFRIKSTLLKLPVMGACEVRDDKIAAWRDYYDPTKLRALMAEATKFQQDR